jgi:hypothetical protein
MPELEDPMILVTAAAVGIVLAIILVVAVVKRSGRRRLESLGPAFELGTTRVVGPLGTSIEGIYRGYSCRLTIEQRSQYSPGGAALRVRATSPQQWSAHVDDIGSRLMVKVGFFKDFGIGDPDLDQRLRFSGDDESSLMSIFSTEAARTAIRSLSTTENFNSVTVRADRAEVKWTPRKPELDDNPDILRDRLEAVTEVLVATGSLPSMG